MLIDLGYQIGFLETHKLGYLIKVLLLFFSEFVKIFLLVSVLLDILVF